MATAELENQQDTAALEASLNNDGGWASLPEDKRDGYLAGLRDKLAAEKEAGATTQRARDESTGRYAKADTETPGKSDETPASADAALAAKPEKGEEVQDWRDAEVKDLATAYGIDEAKLAKIPSREVLDTVLEAIGKQPAAAAAAEKPAEKQAETNQPQQQGTDPFADLTKFKLPDSIDEEAAKPLNAFIETAIAEIKALRAQTAADATRRQAEWQATTARTALATIQGLYPDLYGKPGEKMTSEQTKRANEVIADHFALGARLASRGGNVSPDNAALLKRSVFAIHGEQIINDNNEKHIAKLKASSSRRTGGGTTKAAEAPREGETPLRRALRALPKVRQTLDLHNE